MISEDFFFFFFNQVTFDQKIIMFIFAYEKDRNRISITNCTSITCNRIRKIILEKNLKKIEKINLNLKSDTNNLNDIYI